MPDDWIDKLVEDPASPPRLQVLTGYRGRSAQESHTRLYSDPELTSWVDVPNDAVLLTREVQDELGLGRTLVWTRIDAQIQMGPQAPGTGAEWFQGPVPTQPPGCPQLGAPAMGFPSAWCPMTPNCRPQLGGLGQGGGVAAAKPVVNLSVVPTQCKTICNHTDIPRICEPLPQTPFCPPQSFDFRCPRGTAIFCPPWGTVICR